MSESIRIDIKEIFDIEDRRRIINNFDLMDIVFCVDGDPIDIDPRIKQEFKYTGLNNIDFITSNYYLRKKD